MLNLLKVDISDQDYTQQTVIQNIYNVVSIDNDTPVQYILRDRYTAIREYRKKTNGTQQIAPRQDVPYDDYRIIHTWVGHIDCRKDSVAGSDFNSNLAKLTKAGYVKNNFKHTYMSYTIPPALSGITPARVPTATETVSDQQDAGDVEWCYQYFHPVTFEENGWEPFPALNIATYFNTDAWVIKSVDISDINEGIGCRITLTLEKITPWITILEEIESLGLQSSTNVPNP